MASLQVLMDTVEPRVTGDRLAVLATGLKGGQLHWDPLLGANTVVDMVTYTAFLQPVQWSEAWQTTRYNRLGKANYALTDASWKEASVRFDGDVYLHSLTSPAEAIATNFVLEKNRGIFLSWYAYGTNDQYASLYVILGGVGLAFWSDGNVQVFKPVADYDDFDTAHLVGTGNLTRLDNDVYQQRGAPQGAAGSAVTGNRVDVMVMPWRDRELLVLSNRGGGFSHVFSDLDSEATGQTITAASTVRWWVTTAQADVQMAPLTFALDGAVVSQMQRLRRPPAAAAEADVLPYWSAPGYGSLDTVTATVVDYLGSVEFVGDGAEDRVRLRVELSGDGTNTPYVYGAHGIFEGTTADTFGLDTDITAKALQVDIAVTDSPSGDECTIRAKDIDALGTMIPGVAGVGNRPCEVLVDDVVVWYGRASKPHLIESPAAEATSITWTVSSPWKALQRRPIMDPVPFDRRSLTAVATDLVRMAGYADAEIDIEEFDLELPGNQDASQGNWDLCPEPGDTAAQWLEKLQDEYARGSFMGWVPTAAGRRFKWYMESSLGTTPVYSLFPTCEAAYAQLIIDAWDPADAALAQHQYVYRTFTQDALEPECNDLRVTGWSPRDRRPIQAHISNAAAQDPTLAPDAYPPDWQGEVVNVAYSEPAIHTLAIAERIARERSELLFPVTRMAEVECDMMFKTDGAPVWRGDCVWVVGQGIFRVLSFRASIGMENGGKRWYPSTYTLRRVADDPEPEE